LGDDSSLPPFDAIAGVAFSHVLNTFATHVSPSVQATMYQTGGAILNDAVASSVERVDLMMPNRHYIPVNFAFVGEHEVKDDQHQVFLPSEHPSGLIKASVTRKS
jgi:urate oxidase